MTTGTTMCCHGFVTSDQPRRVIVGASTTAYTIAVMVIMSSADSRRAHVQNASVRGRRATSVIATAHITFDQSVK